MVLPTQGKSHTDFKGNNNGVQETLRDNKFLKGNNKSLLFFGNFHNIWLMIPINHLQVEGLTNQPKPQTQKTPDH